MLSVARRTRRLASRASTRSRAGESALRNWFGARQTKAPARRAIGSVISLRRRVRGPGLQLLVGRVPSRGGTSDVVCKVSVREVECMFRVPFDEVVWGGCIFFVTAMAAHLSP